jgi:hypothetical protein
MWQKCDNPELATDVNTTNNDPVFHVQTAEDRRVLLSIFWCYLFRPSVDAATPKENGYDASSTDTANSRSNNSRTQQAATDRKSSNSQAPQVKEIPIEIKSTTKPKQEEQKHKSSSKQHEEQKHKSSNKQHEEQKHKSSSKQQEEQKHKSSNKQQEEQKPKSSNKQQEEQKPKLSNKQQEAPKHNDTVQPAVPQPPAPTMPQSAVPQPPAPPMPPPPMPGLGMCRPASIWITFNTSTSSKTPPSRPVVFELLLSAEPL